jgi:hypothetical protein
MGASSRTLASRVAQFVAGGGLGSLAGRAVSQAAEAVDVAERRARFCRALSERSMQPHALDALWQTSQYRGSAR